MIEIFTDYGIFLIKTITIVAAIILILSVIINAAQRQKDGDGELHIDNLSDSFRSVQKQMRLHLLTGKARKLAKKKDKKAKQPDPFEQHTFVIDFKGSLDAREVDSLRREVSAILAVADKTKDEVVVRLESPGGVVHGYGLAAAQLKRIRDAEIPLTVAVDKVAASGGYMMACLANKIVAAPFAVVGSIGVLAQLPNFHRLLKKNNIDFEQITAGEYKRTLTVFGENTEKGREKFKEDIEDIHDLFKSFVKEGRPQLDIERVATGEIWFGTRAKEMGLIDDIATSDDLLLEAAKNRDVLKVTYKPKTKLTDKLTHAAQSTIDRLVLDWVQRTRFWRF
nr:protease SohB [Aliidiomarina indica]